MKKIGIIGGDIAGIGFETFGLLVVQQLVEARHTVSIWSENKRHCIGLKKLSKYKNNPTMEISQGALLKKSDFVFIFTLHHHDVELWIKTNFGIQTEDEKILKDKGIIVITRMVAGVSKCLHDAVEKKGGTYLEMQLERSNQANDRLIVMTGGHKSLFDIAEPYFHAFSTHSVYLGPAGSVCTAYLPLQLIKGVYVVGLSEIMHLAEQRGIEKDLICRLLRELGPSKYLTNKADKITKGMDTIIEQPLEELQENIQLGMYLNQELKEPEPLKVCSAVNQRLMLDERYDEHGGFDTSIIFSIFRKT